MVVNGPVRRYFRVTSAETWTWHGELSDQLREWLGEAFVNLDDDHLLVETCDEEIVAVRPGWSICRVDDDTNDVIVMSAGAMAAQFTTVTETT